MAPRKAERSTGDNAGRQQNHEGASQPEGAVLQPMPDGPRPDPESASGLDAAAPQNEAAEDRSGLPSQALPRRGAERIPFGSQKQRLAYPTRPGFVGYWFNDDADRIDRALQAGWDFVRDARGQPVSRPVGRKAEAQGGLRAYRMELPEDIYKADYAAEQARVDAIEAPIKQGTLGAKEGDNRYVPKHTPIKFEDRDKL